MNTVSDLQKKIIQRIEKIKDLEHLHYIKQQIDNQELANYNTLSEEKYIEYTWQILSCKKRRIVAFSKTWAKQFPSTPGVILFFEEGKVCLLVETESIQNTLSEFSNVNPNTLKTRIGLKKITLLPQFQHLAKNKLGLQCIEAYLNQVIEDNFEVSYIYLTTLRSAFAKALHQQYNPVYGFIQLTKNAPSSKVVTQKNYSIQAIRKNYPNAYKPWTKFEDNNLIHLYQKGIPINKLATFFGRNQGAIRSRIKKLN